MVLIASNSVLTAICMFLRATLDVLQLVDNPILKQAFDHDWVAAQSPCLH